MLDEYARTDLIPKKVEPIVIPKKPKNREQKFYPWFFVIGLILYVCLAHALIEFLVNL